MSQKLISFKTQAGTIVQEYKKELGQEYKNQELGQEYIKELGQKY